MCTYWQVTIPIGREHARRRILKEIEELHGKIVQERFDSSSEDFSFFLQKILTPSLFQDTRVFHIGHAQNLSDSQISDLKTLLDNPPPDSYIFLEIDEDKKGRETEVKTAKKLNASKHSSDDNWVYLEFPKPPEYKIAQWLVNQIPLLFGRRISKADADYLVDLAGSDLDTLYSELQKIDIDLAPGAAISRNVIENIVDPSRQMTVFELASALSERQFPRALKIIDSLFATSFYPPVMISALFRHYWALFRIRRFADSNPQVIKKFLNSRGYNNPDQNECAFAIGVASGLLSEGEQRKVYPVIIASGIVGRARNFRDQELALIFKWLLEFDTGIKTGRVGGTQQEVQMFCYKLARVSELVKDGVVA